MVWYIQDEWACDHEVLHPPSLRLRRDKSANGVCLINPAVMECAIGRFTQSNPELMADRYGMPVSAGVDAGPARGVLDLRQLTQVQPDEIFVYPVDQPSWTTVLSLIKGVVTAKGGTLHYAAIIGREYRVPVVINVFATIGQIKTGQRIRFDGTQGVVKVLDK